MPFIRKSLRLRSYFALHVGVYLPINPLICGCCLVAKSGLILCDPMDCRLPDSSVRGISQARILECLPCPPPGDLPNPGIKPEFLASPALAGRFFITELLC